MYSPKVQMPGLGEQSLNGIYLRLDTTNDPLTGELSGVDGTATLPSFTGTTFTSSGMYFLNTSNSVMFSVSGNDFIKIQPNPFRMRVGRGAEAAVLSGTFSVVDADAGILLDRTVASESFITCIVQGTSGGQMRGLTTGGLRFTTVGRLTTMMRLDEAQLSCAIGSNTVDASLKVQQKTGSPLDVINFRTNTGFRTLMYGSGKMAIGQASLPTESAAGLGIGYGNSGAANTNATIQFGFLSGSDLKFNHYFSANHNGSVASGNGIRFWSWDPAGSGSANDFPNDVLIGFSCFGGRFGVGLQTPDAILDVLGAVDPLGDLNDPSDYQMYIQNPSDTDGEGAGIVFTVDATSGTAGSGIIHERTGNNSQGHLNFYTQRSTGNSDPVITLQLQDDGVTYARDGQRGKITETSASTYTLLVTDWHLSYQRSSAGTGTLTLPAIAAGNHGQVYHIKDAGYNASANNITVNTTGADTIENAASGTMTLDGESWTVIANNTTKDWEIQ